MVRVSPDLKLPDKVDLDSLEPMILEAGRKAMAEALRACCREYEARVGECSFCGDRSLQGEGSDERVLLTSFGRVEVAVKQLRCEGCRSLPGLPERSQRQREAEAGGGQSLEGAVRGANQPGEAAPTDGTIQRLVGLRPGGNAEPIKLLEDTIDYLDNQRDWLHDYQALKDQGCPIGSGLVERAVAVAINRRMKKQGMRWRRGLASADPQSGLG